MVKNQNLRRSHQAVVSLGLLYRLTTPSMHHPADTQPVITAPTLPETQPAQPFQASSSSQTLTNNAHQQTTANSPGHRQTP